MIDQLTPETVIALILEQRRHHFLVSRNNARAFGMVLWQRAKQLSHARRYPTVAATPIERRIRCVIKKAVWLLQLVKISSHRGSCAIDVTRVFGRAVRLHLHGGDHVHVVDPVTRFGGYSIRR